MIRMFLIWTNTFGLSNKGEIFNFFTDFFLDFSTNGVPTIFTKHQSTPKGSVIIFLFFAVIAFCYKDLIFTSKKTKSYRLYLLVIHVITSWLDSSIHRNLTELVDYNSRKKSLDSLTLSRKSVTSSKQQKRSIMSYFLPFDLRLYQRVRIFPHFQLKILHKHSSAFGINLTRYIVKTAIKG